MRGQRATGADLTCEGQPIAVGGQLPVAEFVRLAIAMTTALDDWHRRDGTHGGLSPEMFRVKPDGLRLTAPHHRPASAEYAAPEQSGRLSYGVDERTDLYVLGLVFYQLLSGRSAFEATSPADWWRCHLTETPAPLGDPVAHLPPALCEIVLLLLEKAPDDRYQTARGLLADLERCRAAVAADDAETPLLLRLRDVPDRLILSGKVYGRERQLTKLQTSYDRVSTGGPAELVAVTADAGLGKWSTVTEFADAVVTKGGLTIRAVCGHDDTAPYAALSRLLVDLARQMSDVPREVRDRIADAVGLCGATLVDLVPELADLLGDRPAPVDTSVVAARERLHLATRRLFGAVGAPARPLVVAIRDVQWTDRPTTEALRYLLAAPDAPAVLVVVTYRAGDIGGPHPMQALLGDHRVPSSTAALRPLPDSALADMLADTLRSGMRDSSTLSRTVAAKTGSNPLLVGNFLHHLAERDLLAYTAEGTTWQWQQRRVDEESRYRDVGALLRPRLDRFDAGTRHALELAAVIGPRFDAATVSVVAATAAAPTPPPRPAKAGPVRQRRPRKPAVDADRIAAQLTPAVRAELLIAAAPPGEYRWRHEQIRQAVLAGLDPRRRAELCLAAGRTLHDRPAGLFAAVGHLNTAIELLTTLDENRWLAELNLRAGERATRVGAVAAAREYLAMGLDLLDEAAWRQQYPLAFGLHLSSARAERAAGNPDRAHRLLDFAADHANDDIDRARLLGLRAALRRDAGDRVAALRTGIEALALLGVDLPSDPARWPAAAAAAVERTRAGLDQAALDKLAEAPDCADPRLVLATNLIADLVYPTWPDNGGRDLLTVVGVELALEQGPTTATAFTLVRLASVLAQSRYESDARRCARAGLQILERPDQRMQALTRATAAIVGPSWLDAPASMIRELYRAYRAAVEEGEVRAAQRIGSVYTVHRFAVGTPLDQVAADLDARWRFARRHGNDDAASAVIRLLDEAVSKLRGLSCDAPSPTDDETTAIGRVLRGEHGYYSVVGLTPLLTAAQMLGDDSGAIALADVAGRAVANAPSSFLTAETAFANALTLASRCENADPATRRRLLGELEQAQVTLDDLPARGPGLFRALSLLLSAERARLTGDDEQARGRFDRAIGAAREYGFTRLEGLAAELGGRYALGRGEAGEAVAYLRRARACYQRWGAEAKLDQLDELLASASPPADSTPALDQLDLLTVVRAFQAISGELRLDRLVGVLLELLVQHSQADRGCLLLAEGTALTPAAEAEVDRDRVRVNTRMHHGRLHNRVPLRVVEHTARTREVLAGGLDDELAAFATDPYLATNRPRSVLCAPIERRGAVVAVLYLEHRRLAAAFSRSYLELLEVLCTQAAIALENATTHARLVDANRVLDATFDQLPVGLIQLGADLRVRRASPRAVEVTGLPLTPGMPLMEFLDVLAPVDADRQLFRFDPGLAAVATTTTPIDREIELVTRTGERLRLATTAIPLRDELGALVGVTVLVAPVGG